MNIAKILQSETESNWAKPGIIIQSVTEVITKMTEKPHYQLEIRNHLV